MGKLLLLLSPVLVILPIFVCGASRNVDILHFKNVRKDGGYQFEFEGQDGTKRQEIGSFVYRNLKPVLQVKGSYSYRDGSGRLYTVHYEADDKGTKTRGDIIPPFTKHKGRKEDRSITTAPKTHRQIPLRKNRRRKQDKNSGVITAAPEIYDTLKEQEQSVIQNFTTTTTKSLGAIWREVTVTGSTIPVNGRDGTDQKESGNIGTLRPIEQPIVRFRSSTTTEGTSTIHIIPPAAPKTHQQLKEHNIVPLSKNRRRKQHKNSRVITAAPEIYDTLKEQEQSVIQNSTSTTTKSLGAIWREVTVTGSTIPVNGRDGTDQKESGNIGTLRPIEQPIVRFRSSTTTEGTSTIHIIPPAAPKTHQQLKEHNIVPLSKNRRRKQHKNSRVITAAPEIYDTLKEQEQSVIQNSTSTTTKSLGAIWREVTVTGSTIPVNGRDGTDQKESGNIGTLRPIEQPIVRFRPSTTTEGTSTIHIIPPAAPKTHQQIKEHNIVPLSKNRRRKQHKNSGVITAAPEMYDTVKEQEQSIIQNSTSTTTESLGAIWREVTVTGSTIPTNGRDETDHKESGNIDTLRPIEQPIVRFRPSTTTEGTSTIHIIPPAAPKTHQQIKEHNTGSLSKNRRRKQHKNSGVITADPETYDTLKEQEQSVIQNSTSTTTKSLGAIWREVTVTGSTIPANGRDGTDQKESENIGTLRPIEQPIVRFRSSTTTEGTSTIHIITPTAPKTHQQIKEHNIGSLSKNRRRKHHKNSGVITAAPEMYDTLKEQEQSIIQNSTSTTTESLDEIRQVAIADSTIPVNGLDGTDQKESENISNIRPIEQPMVRLRPSSTVRIISPTAPKTHQPTKEHNIVLLSKNGRRKQDKISGVITAAPELYGTVKEQEQSTIQNFMTTTTESVGTIMYEVTVTDSTIPVNGHDSKGQKESEGIGTIRLIEQSLNQTEVKPMFRFEPNGTTEGTSTVPALRFEEIDKDKNPEIDSTVITTLSGGIID